MRSNLLKQTRTHVVRMQLQDNVNHASCSSRVNRALIVQQLWRVVEQTSSLNWIKLMKSNLFIYTKDPALDIRVVIVWYVIDSENWSVFYWSSAVRPKCRIVLIKFVNSVRYLFILCREKEKLTEFGAGLVRTTTALQS